MINQTLKLLLIGESQVGKSSIINRFAGDDFSESTMSTVGVDFKNREMVVDGKSVKLQIWDSAGQERFRTIVASYFRGAHGVMIVYDVTSRASFEKVQNWMSQLDEQAAETVSRVLIGNKCDLVARRAVSTEEGQALADSLKLPFLETSAKNATNVEDAFILLTRQVRARAAADPILNKPKRNVNLARTGKLGDSEGEARSEREAPCC